MTTFTRSTTSTTTEVDVMRRFVVPKTTPARVRPPVARPTIEGRYDIFELLGAGGMGSVFHAVQRGIDRRVALKVMTPRGDGDGDESRFLREARALGSFAHPNIVAIHDAGRTDDGRPYIAMEHVDGGTLRDELNGRGRIRCADSIPIVQGICAALAHAHTLGFVHRDIKPENVMLDRQRRPPLVKVVDFGLAKPLRTRDGVDGEHESENKRNARDVVSRPGQVVGTVAYMSPERMLGSGDDARVDLYSLGVVWYEMLTGANPFAGLSGRDTFLRLMMAKPPVPSALRPGIGITPVVDELVMQLLEHTPSKRPHAHDVLRVLADA